VVPSHYHVAARWHGRMHFLDPVAEGRFRALDQVLSGLSLAEASSALEFGRVVDRETGARVGYRPAAMIMPASEPLQRHFDDAWAREVEAAQAELRLELEPRR